jgi:hypothetical protein
MYIDVLGSWDTGGRRLTINSGFSYYPSTPDFAFRAARRRAELGGRGPTTVPGRDPEQEQRAAAPTQSRIGCLLKDYLTPPWTAPPSLRVLEDRRACPSTPVRLR